LEARRDVLAAVRIATGARRITSHLSGVRQDIEKKRETMEWVIESNFCHQQLKSRESG
jgi:hypothetical protein